MMRDRRLIVGGERKNEGALTAQFHVDAGCASKLFRKGRPALLALASERDQRLFAWLRLAASRQHTGCGVACARASLATIEQRNGRARSEPPGHAKPDHARADDDDAGLVSDWCDGMNSVAQRGSLRWYDPDSNKGSPYSPVA